MAVCLSIWTPSKLQKKNTISNPLNELTALKPLRTDTKQKSYENDTKSHVIPGWSSALNCSHIQRTARSKLVQLCHLSEWMLPSVAHTGTHQFRLDRHTTTTSNRHFSQASCRNAYAGISAKGICGQRNVAYANVAHVCGLNQLILSSDLVCERFYFFTLNEENSFIRNGIQLRARDSFDLKLASPPQISSASE